jgi:pyruvate-ferredoxin/flavodoxin oxidoreductase
MQGIVLLGIFLRITPFQKDLALSEEAVFQGVEKSLRKYFGKRGDRVVQDNLLAVGRGYHEVIEVPREVMASTAPADRANAALRVMQGAMA